VSQFSNQLQGAIEQQGFTQVDVCDKTGVSQGQLSRYVAGKDRPSPEALDQLAKAFDEKNRTRLLVAYLEDDIPPGMRALATVKSKTSESKTSEEPTVYRSRMPKKLRAAYDYLGAAALEKPSIAQMLITAREAIDPEKRST
jgi:transcriptional regulator with XRE-family HTH domain